MRIPFKSPQPNPKAIMRYVVVEQGVNSELFWSLSRKEAKEWMTTNQGTNGGYRSIMGEYTNMITLI